MFHKYFDSCANLVIIQYIHFLSVYNSGEISTIQIKLSKIIFNTYANDSVETKYQ